MIKITNRALVIIAQQISIWEAFLLSKLVKILPHQEMPSSIGVMLCGTCFISCIIHQYPILVALLFCM